MHVRMVLLKFLVLLITYNLLCSLENEYTDVRKTLSCDWEGQETSDE